MRVRHAVTSAVVSVLLGAATSVAVAWIGSEFSIPPRWERERIIGGGRILESGWLFDARRWVEPPASGASCTTYRFGSSIPAGQGTWVEYGSGFPMACLFKWSAEYEPLRGAIALPDPDGVSEAFPGQATRGLPITPIWRGMVVDTAFWGGVWWAGVRLIWRRFRR